MMVKHSMFKYVKDTLSKLKCSSYFLSREVNRTYGNIVKLLIVRDDIDPYEVKKIDGQDWSIQTSMAKEALEKMWDGIGYIIFQVPKY